MLNINKVRFNISFIMKAIFYFSLFFALLYHSYIYLVLIDEYKVQVIKRGYLDGKSKCLECPYEYKTVEAEHWIIGWSHGTFDD